MFHHFLFFVDQRISGQVLIHGPPGRHGPPSCWRPSPPWPNGRILHHHATHGRKAQLLGRQVVDGLGRKHGDLTGRGFYVPMSNVSHHPTRQGIFDSPIFEVMKKINPQKGTFTSPCRMLNEPPFNGNSRILQCSYCTKKWAIEIGGKSP